MAGKYQFTFDEGTVYASVRDVMLRMSRPGGVVDLGCGHGALAEVCQMHGMRYIGVDVERQGLLDLESRGFRNYELDLNDLDAVEALLDKIASDGGISTILMLDTLEHLPEPWKVLERLSRAAVRWGSPPLVISIPNVTHVDVAAKLLAGRWDVTPTGLLDSTHLQFFSEDRLEEMMRRAGWYECDRADFKLNHSDQHFAADLPVLAAGSSLADLVKLVRAGADPYQPVRASLRPRPGSRRRAPRSRRPRPVSVLARAHYGHPTRAAAGPPAVSGRPARSRLRSASSRAWCRAT